MAGRDEDDYSLTDGERICSMAIGWNFGDGHMHNEQLIAALQRRCHFDPDEVRVVLLDAQPIHRQTQRYRLVDAATGEFERGWVEVADMVVRQPWDDESDLSGNPLSEDSLDRLRQYFRQTGNDLQVDEAGLNAQGTPLTPPSTPEPMEE